MSNTIVKIYNKIYDNDLFQNGSLTLLLFFVGLVNSRRHLSILKIPFINRIILIIFAALLAVNLFIIVINHFRYKELYYKIGINKYWQPLIIIILVKYLILFLQVTYTIITHKLTIDNLIADYPIYWHVVNMIRIIVNFTIIFILISRIDNFSKLNSSIGAFGLGCLIAPVLGFIFFPNLIGKRISDVNGVYFAGSFWNASVIAFVSSAWLLIGNICNNQNKLKKYIYLLMAMTMFVGGIAGLSRAIVVSGVVSLLVYIICLRDIKKILKIIALLLIFILVVQLQFGIIFENFKARLKSISGIRNEGRIKIWKDYLEDINDFFILGEPLEGYRIFSKIGQVPHSVLLSWWSQFGVFAAIAFIWLIWGIWKSASDIYNLSIEQGAAVFAWLFAYLSLAMINETGYKELPFYAAMGILFAWGNLAKSKFTTKI